MNSLHRTLPVVAFAMSIAGCATPMGAVDKPASVIHQYQVVARDVNGHPVAGVSVSAKLKGLYTEEKKMSCVTDESGDCATFGYEVQAGPYRHIKDYSSSASIEGNKDGYYSNQKNASSNYGSSYSSASNIIKIDMQMIRPIDYLKDNFAVSNADKDLRERVLRFINVIRLQSVINDAEVSLKGIGTTDFKGKKYLQVKLNSATTYNTLKLNQYDIGKRLFDETVRKVLNPLNDAIAAPKAYYGYDIVVTGHSKNFVNKYAISDNNEYRFLMPEATVRRYKEKDISGQELLNSSVILLNDERIDLKLQ